MISKSQKLSVCLGLLLMVALTACSELDTPEVSPAATITPAEETPGTASPMETPTGEVPSGDVSSSDEEELVLYRGSNPYRSTPYFEIYYPPSDWDYVEDDELGRFHQLYHQDIDGCVVWLLSGGIGALFIDTVDLGDVEWKVFQVDTQIVNYSVQWQDIAFIFGLTIPEPYSIEEDSPCKKAAEEVMATFEVISDPLPYTVKGYELYSWYKEPEGEWYFTLITGTNRLKTYGEITNRSFAENGWVNITVDGVQPLKFLLDRIPGDTPVTWIGPDWLERVQADKALVETISLPEREVIEEIDGYCQRLGVDLVVEDGR
jgi:hypothetical protein